GRREGGHGHGGADVDAAISTSVVGPCNPHTARRRVTLPECELGSVHASRIEPLEVLRRGDIVVEEPNADLVLFAHPPLSSLAAFEVERCFGTPEVDGIGSIEGVDPIGAATPARLPGEQVG